MRADLMRVISAYYDNSLDNIGNHSPFAWYGTRWAQASTAPSRLYNMYMTEGGIRVPFLVRYPQFAREKQNGTIIRAFSSVMDICPTLLELAGVTHPASEGKPGTSRGREVVPRRDKSWVPLMTGATATASEAGDAIHGDTAKGWEQLFGRGALYNLSKDLGEITDLSEAKLEMAKELLEMWERYRKETGVVWGTPIRYVGEQWDGNYEEGIIGRDAITQTRAWIKVWRNETPPVKA
ncbi:Fc.00g104000.m01.CDS01 [Cosmosporella sp. VM-42]